MSDVAKAIAESAASVAQKQSEAAAHAKDQGMGMDLCLLYTSRALTRIIFKSLTREYS